MRKALVSGIASHWPFANGAGRFIDRLGQGITLGTGQSVHRTSDGFDIDVLDDDLIGRHIALSGRFDRSPIGVLLYFCEEGDRCADIGANIGYVSCVLLQRVANSHVLSIEPQPEVLRLLHKNLSRFPAERWTILQAGLSDGEGEGFLALNHANRGASKLVGSPSTDTIAVPLLPADRVLAGLDRLDIIKMDIEGHEEAVFRSGLQELRRLNPRAILFEDSKGQTASDGPIGRLLANAGYRVFGIRKELFATRLLEVTSDNCHSFNDFIAASTGRPLPSAARAKYGL